MSDRAQRLAAEFARRLREADPRGIAAAQDMALALLCEEFPGVVAGELRTLIVLHSNHLPGGGLEIDFVRLLGSRPEPS